MFKLTCVLVLLITCVRWIPAVKAGFPSMDVASGNFRIRLTFPYDSTHPKPVNFTTMITQDLSDLFLTVPSQIQYFAYLLGYDPTSTGPFYYFLDILPQADDAKQYWNDYFYYWHYTGTTAYYAFHRGILSNVTAVEQMNCDGSYSYVWQNCTQRNWLGIILGTTFAVIGFIIIVVLFKLWRQKKRRESQIAASVVPAGGHAAGHKPPPANIKPLFTKTQPPPTYEPPPPPYEPISHQHHKHIQQQDEPEGEDLEAQPIKHTRHHSGGTSSPRKEHHHGSLSPRGGKEHHGSSSPRGHHHEIKHGGKQYQKHKSTRHSDSLP